MATKLFLSVPPWRDWPRRGKPSVMIEPRICGVKIISRQFDEASDEKDKLRQK